MTDLAPSDPAGDPDEGHPWLDDAACKGMGASLWYPEKGQTAQAGRDVCARCPVMAPCLACGLERPETHGMWGGADQRTLRRMRTLRRRELAWLPPDHPADRTCDSRRCRWCRAVDGHRATLLEPTGPKRTNSPGARHGYRSTYVRGCRCGPCSLAIGAYGAKLREAGQDVPQWWARWFGDNTERRLVWHAKRLAEFETTAEEAA